MTDLLAVEGLRAGYGDAVILEDVTISLAPGSSLALLGRNGVGKTTFLLTLMGLTKRHRGSIRWQGTDIANLPPHRRAQGGIGWVPQERHVFPSLTVDEHLLAVAKPGAWTPARVYANFPSLAERKRNLGQQLSGGEQQMLAIGRALVLNPQLLLLDEPMEGLAPIIVQDLRRVIGELMAGGDMSVILVEQHVKMALAIAETVVVLERGRIVHRAKSADLAADPDTLHRLLAVA